MSIATLFVSVLAALGAPALGALAANAPACAPASAPVDDALLVDVSWLADRLPDESIVVLHVGPEEEYPSRHLPGAHYASAYELAAPRDTASLTLELPTPEALEAALEAFGISDESQVVVYAAEGWVTAVARVMFTLDWAGFGDRAHWLDGGLEAWEAAGLPVTSEVPHVESGSLTLTPRPELVVDHEWVAGFPRDDQALVDARPTIYYEGLRLDRGVRGHITHAASAPWTELLDADVYFIDAEARRAFLDRAGVEPGDTVVGYCHIGQYATLVLFAARTLGHEVRLYDGSMDEWSTVGGAMAMPVPGESIEEVPAEAEDIEEVEQVPGEVEEAEEVEDGEEVEEVDEVDDEPGADG